MGVVARLTILGNGHMQTHAAKQDVCSVSKTSMRIDQHASADGT